MSSVAIGISLSIFLVIPLSERRLDAFPTLPHGCLDPINRQHLAHLPESWQCTPIVSKSNAPPGHYTLRVAKIMSGQSAYQHVRSSSWQWCCLCSFPLPAISFSCMVCLMRP